MSRVALHRPAGLFDGGFSYSATVSSGPLLFTAGISPLDADGGVVAPGDALAQVRRCLVNLRTVLADQRCAFAEIAKLTVYVVVGDETALARVWEEVNAEFDSQVPPAMLLAVAALPYPGQVVEVDAIAAP